MAANADDDDSFSSSSSSDDEFLTIGGSNGAGTEDREAIIRKKLLESFYGKTAVHEDTEGQPASAKKDDSSAAADESFTNKTDQTTSRPTRSDSVTSSSRGNDESARSDDLDSPYFDADNHTSTLTFGCSVHTLLETEERLALQVRTLDSTMQTLVYENYSKFIDATDAIRSIGVSVNANEEGLTRLSRGMQTIDDQSRAVEQSLGSLRDAVAEKLRVKRLLTRLDALLKLPATLQQQIAAGKYRLATKSYLSASSILSKHSAGFESLKSIETECHAILTKMVRDLRRKLLHWSGRKNSLRNIDGSGEDDLDAFGADDDMNDVEGGETSGWVPPPEPPQSVSEIFECAGTLAMVLVPNEDPTVQQDKTRDTFDSGLSADDCTSMALASSMRLLDRILDAHHIELQEAKFESKRLNERNFVEPQLGGIADPREGDSIAHSAGNHLIPTSFLDSMLEAATLYGLSFGSGSVESLDENDRSRLVDFVSEAFATFLGHVRSVLLEQSLLSESEADQTEEMEEDDGDGAYLEISAAMAHLLRSVRDLASGLALPEVGIDVEVASSLVDKTVEVTEATVRRRVAQKFYSLRVRVLKDCLAPLIKHAAVDPVDSAGTRTSRVAEVVQMTNVALSDSLQLIDDVVRSILSGGVVLGSATSAIDFSMVKQAVQTSACRFAVWLASTLEVLAGCETSDPKLIVEVTDAATEEEEEAGLGASPIVSGALVVDDWSDVSGRNDAISDVVQTALRELLTMLEKETSVTAYSDLTLAISAMCRLAERSVMENVNQSILSSEDMGKKTKSSGLFPSVGQSRTQKGYFDGEKTVSERFRLAASRVLALYSLNRGGDAASIACDGFYAMACSAGDGIPDAPRSAAWQVLEVAKLTSLDCANVFGGEKRAGPVPLFSDDIGGASSSPLMKRPTALSGSTLGHMAAIKGLQLDVERMFTEKVAIYPHPFRFMDFGRDAVVTIVFKVAFKAMMEHSRICVFTTQGYRQLQVDVEFFRIMIPHFVKEDFLLDGTNACTILYNLLNEVMLNAGERCEDVDCVGKNEYYDAEQGMNRTPSSIVRGFMTPSDTNEASQFVSRFTIAEE